MANAGTYVGIWKVKALANRPNADAAQTLLEKIAEDVKVIVSAHKWKVRLLQEMDGGNPNVGGMNCNYGQKILVRLRHPRTGDFNDYGTLIHVMLHELSHMDHGNHSAEFYDLLGQLKEEYYNKSRLGGVLPFSGSGVVLGGGGIARPLDVHAVAASAAEKRLRIQSFMPGGGRRLGGSLTSASGAAAAVTASFTPAQSAGEAAERRLAENESCRVICDGMDCGGEADSGGGGGGSGDGGGSSGGSSSGVASGGGGGGSSSDSAKNGQESESVAKAPLQPGWWECGLCTLHNRPMSLTCDACATIRSSDGGGGASSSHSNGGGGGGNSKSTTQGVKGKEATKRRPPPLAPSLDSPGWLCPKCLHDNVVPVEFCTGAGCTEERPDVGLMKVRAKKQKADEEAKAAAEAARATSTGGAGSWAKVACKECTYLNPIGEQKCLMCDTAIERQGDGAGRCGRRGNAGANAGRRHPEENGRTFGAGALGDLETNTPVLIDLT